MSENQMQVATTTKSPVQIGSRGITPTTMDELYRFATAVSKSGLAPKGMESAESIFVALEMGLEVGLPLMASLQNIAVINGRPTIWGDAQLAVVRATGELEEFAEWYEEKGNKLPRNPSAFTDETTAICRIKRRGQEAQETGFSVGDAKRANLWGKAGPWSQYPARMLRFRSRSFALRDGFGDALRGLRSTEEVMDDPVEKAVNVTPATPFKRAETHSAPDTGPAITQTQQDQLANIVCIAGHTFDDLQSYAKGMGLWESDLGGFYEIPHATATKLVAAQKSLLTALASVKGGAK
jgi:hypothetical protein